MKIQLPLENWAELLPFVPRPQLVALLFKLDDRQFATILQYCLNEEGHITLGHLRIVAAKESYAINGPIVELCEMFDGWTVLETPIPDEPIPKNVNNFKSLTFSYFDLSVLDFLQKFHQHQNALLANVNLAIHFPHFSLSLVKLQPMLAQILPLIGDNINSLQLDNYNDDFSCHNWLLECNENNDVFSELVTKMLTQTRILSIKDCDYVAFDWYCRWLSAPRMDGRPRMLCIYLEDGYEALDFIDLIKKDFLMAKHPVTFFIRMVAHLDLEDICLENGETNENLLVDKKWHGVFLISRFQKEANGVKWIEAYGQEILEFGHVNPDRTICLDLNIQN